MFIINPIITNTNINEIEAGDTFEALIKLMSFKFNERLNKMLHGHGVMFTVKKRDLIGPSFEEGSVVFVSKNNISVICIGVSSQSTLDSLKDSVQTLLDGLDGECVIFCDEAISEIPGAAALKEAIDVVLNTACSDKPLEANNDTKGSTTTKKTAAKKQRGKKAPAIEDEKTTGPRMEYCSWDDMKTQLVSFQSNSKKGV
jgi:hypothetical protein